ncbi:uncharacterized protein LOC117339572 [Pecten maximus]|uniref:uncharacterized protein LOC117339572 n=1 Tax=Pecten maximus TaxID=6579 RepID=UPI001458129A|nr:uncharacterized protein LOC117339572 [Pecten maximus]XP_033757147.1 uncharacterized protein LOC117339572 [Pecten maximus]
MTSDSSETGRPKVRSAESKPTQPPIHKYISPAEFKMRVLRKLTSVDNNNTDNKSLTKFQRQDSDRTLKASIVFPNGDVGTLISYEKMDSTKPVPSERELPAMDTEQQEVTSRKQERPLRLPPIMLPPIYSTKPLPLLSRDFSLPVDPPAPLSDDDWEELQECRYLRLYSPRKYRSNSIPA